MGKIIDLLVALLAVFAIIAYGQDVVVVGEQDHDSRAESYKEIAERVYGRDFNDDGKIEDTSGAEVDRILDRSGKMRGAPRDAIIADVSTKENRGSNFGILRAADNLGAIVGILICIFFFTYLGYQKLFLLAAIPSLVGVGLIYSLVKERRAEEVKTYKGISFKNLSPQFKLFLVASAVFALGSFSYSFLLIYAKQFGFKVAFIPVLYLIFTVAAFLLSYPFGKLSDKIGRKPVMYIAFGLWAVVLLGLLFFHAYWAVILVFIIYGLHRAALDTVQKTFVSELAPELYRASSLGGFQMVIGLCALPSSLAAGLLWDSMGMYVPLVVSLVLTAVSFVVLMFVKEN